MGAQVVLNMLVTKDLSNIFNYIYPWGETIASIAWFMRAYYHRTIQASPDQDFFGRYMIFNLVTVIHWRVITNGKQ